MRSENAKYTMHGVGRGVLAVPMLAVAGFVARDAFYSISAKPLTREDRDPEAMQSQAEHINTNLEKTFFGPQIIKTCTGKNPDNTASYITCAADSVFLPMVGFEIAIAFFAATTAFPMLNRALGYFRLAKNAQTGNLVHNFMGKAKAEPDVNQYDPRFDPGSEKFNPDADEDKDAKKAVETHTVRASAFATAGSFTIQNGMAPVAEIVLAPNETVITERGAMMAMDDGIEMEAMTAKAQSLMSGEGLIKNSFRNSSDKDRKLVLTPKTPGELVEIDLSVEHRILCDNGAFFASHNPVDVGVISTGDKSMRVFSSMGRVLQTITQADAPARVLLSSSGQVYRRELDQGDSVAVQGDSILAMSETVEVSLKEVHGVATRLFGGENKFLVNVEGPGRLWLSTKGPEEESQSGGSIFRTIRGLLPG